MMTGAKPQLAGIISPRFSSTPSLGKKEGGGGGGGLGKAPQCDILHYFLLHRRFGSTIRRMSLNLGDRAN